ncbi:MAG: mechanosensitive ion channel domain-containing protein [Alphaproteobacteria bacterium]
MGFILKNLKILSIFTFIVFFNNLFCVSTKSDELSTIKEKLLSVETFIDKAQFTQETITANRELLSQIRQDSYAEKEQITYDADILQKRIETITQNQAQSGNEKSITKEFSAKKQALDKDYNTDLSKLEEIDDIIAEINKNDSVLSVINRKMLISKLTERGPIPIYPSIVIKAVPEFIDLLGKILTTPIDWYRHTDSTHKKRLFIDSTPVIFLILLSSFFVWFASRMLLKKFCVRCKTTEPSYSRRLVVAFIEACGKSFVYATFVMGVYFWISEFNDIFSETIINLSKSFLFWFLITSIVFIFSKSFFSPPSPEWNLFPIPLEKTKSLGHLIDFLVLVFATQGLFLTATSEFDSSSDLIVFGSAVLGCFQAFLIISLMNARLWSDKLNDDEDDEKTSHLKISENGEDVEEYEDEDYWSFVRFLVGFVSVAGLAAYLIGYMAFGRFLITRLAYTGLSAIVFLLFRGLLLEMIRFLMFSGIIRKKLGIGFKGLRKLKFFLALAVDPILIFLILMLLLPAWGVPRQDMMHWVIKALTGFSVGGVNISLIGIVLAMIVFVSVIFLSKFARKRLVERVLSETKLDISIQHSLAAGIGYIGVIIAAALAVIVMGIDLTNLALVAGALSVGIGFGLQNLVNNFVSGIIILLERPIKVGDWIIVSDKEGLVKQINIRATELETFQRASVIVPNADIISNYLVNLTHKDRYGRIEIPVGVSYGSDVEKVRSVLLKAARSNERVLKFPSPRVLFMDFGESSLNFELHCFTANVVDKRFVASELRFEINKLFIETHIEIPFPQRVVHFATPLVTKGSEPAPQHNDK